MKVFIAGSTGLVGSSLARNSPENVTLLTPSRSEVNLEKYEEVKSYIAQNKPDVVILAAAKVGGIAANNKNQTEFLVSNLNIQNSVIVSAHELGVRKLLFLGSSCVYPKYALQPISENSLMTGSLEPTNEGYAIAKIAGIRLTKAIYEESSFDYFSVMPTNLYGPNDNYNSFSSHVPAALIRRFHEAKINKFSKVAVWGSGKPKREFMFVDDLADACWFLLAKPHLGGELINVGTGEDISISDFANLVSEIVGFEGEIEFDSSKPDGTPRKLLDVSKVNSMGWKARVDLKSGLMKTYESFLKELSEGKVRGY